MHRLDDSRSVKAAPGNIPAPQLTRKKQHNLKIFKEWVGMGGGYRR
jgi:hypothetical protein